jgi:hypothetical protein
MLTTRLTGEKTPDFDTKIIDFIESNKTDDSDGHVMVIGIDNLENKLYRIIEADGVDDYMALLEFLESINLKDILSFGIRVRTKGCHMRFRQFHKLNINTLDTNWSQGYSK